MQDWLLFSVMRKQRPSPTLPCLVSIKESWSVTEILWVYQSFHTYKCFQFSLRTENCRMY